MKTAQIIAEQQAQSESLKTEKPAAKRYGRGQHPNSRANIAPWKYKPGESGNPGGRPRDVAGDIYRAIFENNTEAIYKGAARRIIAGEPYAIQVGSERAYGKLKQGIIHTGNEEGGPVRASIRVEFVKPDGQ